MKCKYCGTPLEDGRIFCLKCGEEIVWVPEYNAISSYRSQSEQAVIEATRRAVENDKKKQEALLIAEAENAEKKKRKKKITTRIIIAIVVLLLLSIGGFWGAKYYIEQKNHNDIYFQLNEAHINYAAKEYDTALEYTNRALELEPDHLTALFMKGDILLAQGNKEAAIQFMMDLRGKTTDEIGVYGELIAIYEAQGEPAAIKELLAQCTNKEVLDAYAEYIVEEPSFSHESGEYNELVAIKIDIPQEMNESIYYTIDGSEPTDQSTKYTEEIDLAEGTTKIRTIAINEKEICSDVAEATYTIKLLPPEPPKISPSPGDFTPEMDAKIHILVPPGCTAYYAFDEAPTESSARYTEPIDMLAGEHTFYAILIDKYGKQSDLGSAFYNLINQ